MKVTARKTTRKSDASGSNLRRFNPTAQPPTEAVLKRIPPADRALLESLLSGPVECIYHPSFRRRHMPGEDKYGVHTHDNPYVPMIELGPTDVLTANQEQVLFLRFNYCRHRIMRVLRQNRGKRLLARPTRELLLWARRAQAIRTEIVRANTSLVLAMARRSRNSGIEIGELVSEGNLALLRCVDKFDASKGFKFSTYACRAILASFSRAGAKAARYRVQFPTTYDPALERSDYLDTRRERVEHECVDDLKRILFENSADLSTVERRVLDARFSLDEPEETRNKTRRKTLDQVGHQLGVSKERVRQIQNQAMNKIRAVLEEQLLAAS